MSRLMSVAMTADAVIERRKTVTRRKGWRFLKPGDTLTLCRKVQGRKPGEPLERLAEVEVVDVRREPLHLVREPGEVEREGFRQMPWFVGVELDPRAVPLGEFLHPERACYLLGAEDHGLQPSVTDRCHSLVRVEAVQPQSMNVAVAGSLVLYSRHMARQVASV